MIKNIGYFLLIIISAYALSSYDIFYKKQVISNSVVHIVSKNKDKTVIGNGIIIDYLKNNYILTNSHVCNISDDTLMSVKSKKQFYEFSNDGFTFFTHDEYDLCLIKMSDYEKGYYSISENFNKDSNNANFLGFRNNKLTLIKGKENKPLRSIATINQKIYDFNPIAGDSGSLVFNDRYEMIGIMKSQIIKNNKSYGKVISDIAIIDFLKRAEGFIPPLQQVP